MPLRETTVGRNAFALYKAPPHYTKPPHIIQSFHTYKVSTHYTKLPHIIESTTPLFPRALYFAPPYPSSSTSTALSSIAPSKLSSTPTFIFSAIAPRPIPTQAVEKELFDSNIWNYVGVASDQPLRESSKPCIHNGVAIISVHLQPFVVKPGGYLPLPVSLFY